MTLLQELTDLFPDIQEADAVRILLHLGYTPDELHQAPAYIEHKGNRIMVPVSYVTALEYRNTKEQQFDDAKLQEMKTNILFSVNSEFAKYNDRYR